MATKQTTNRKLGMESLEDRKLMTVMTEFAELSRPDQIGSEHWPEPAAEVAVEKVMNDRQGYFSRGLHNNGAFRAPGGHILWNTTDNSEDSSKSYTDSGRITSYAYELKNVQVVSVGGTLGSARSSNDPVFFNHHANVDAIWGGNVVLMTGQETVDPSDSFTPTTDLPDGDYYVQGESQPTNQSSLNFEEIKVTFKDAAGNKTSSYTENDNTGEIVIGIPSCPEFEAATDVVFGQRDSLEHGPGMHDSFFSRFGGQEGEAVDTLSMLDLRKGDLCR